MPQVLSVAISLLVVATACASEPTTIALIGDSTVTNHEGWGKAFAARVDDHAKVLNFAAGGRSSKSWYDEKRLPAVLEAAPDYVLIQFGHNDQPGKGPKRETDPNTTYREFLKLYVTEFRKVGTQPIIVSSVARRRFDASGKIRTTLGPWAEAARLVAQETNVPFVDLHRASIEYHNKIGEEASRAFNPKPSDVTHFTKEGAAEIAALVVRELKELNVGFAASLK